MEISLTIILSFKYEYVSDIPIFWRSGKKLVLNNDEERIRVQEQKPDIVAQMKDLIKQNLYQYLCMYKYNLVAKQLYWQFFYRNFFLINQFSNHSIESEVLIGSFKIFLLTFSIFLKSSLSMWINFLLNVFFARIYSVARAAFLFSLIYVLFWLQHSSEIEMSIISQFFHSAQVFG